VRIFITLPMTDTTVPSRTPHHATRDLLGILQHAPGLRRDTSEPQSRAVRSSSQATFDSAPCALTWVTLWPAMVAIACHAPIW
jgi:hypothetical protein